MELITETLYQQVQYPPVQKAEDHFFSCHGGGVGLTCGRVRIGGDDDRNMHVCTIGIGKQK